MSMDGLFLFPPKTIAKSNIPLKWHFGNTWIYNRDKIFLSSLFFGLYLFSCQRLKIMGTDTDGSYIISNGPVCNKFQIVPVKSADTVFADPFDL